MDFSKCGATFSSTSPMSKASPSAGRTKYATITICSLIVDVGDGKHVRAAIRVQNSFPVKSLLTYGAEFPNKLFLDADTKIIYPDKADNAARSAIFSEEILAVFPKEALMKTSSWMPSAVITLVADKDPMKVKAALVLIKSLQDQVIINEIGDAMTIKVKDEGLKNVSAAEVPILKMYLMDMFASRKKVVNQELSTSPVPINYVLLGEEDENDKDEEVFVVQASSSVGKRNGKTMIPVDDFDDDDFLSSSSSSSSSSSFDPKYKKSKK